LTLYDAVVLIVDMANNREKIENLKNEIK